MGDLKEKHYKEVFDATFAQLTLRRRLKQLSLEECRKLLETEYINQGNDWVGRGSLQEIVSSATIAAYEVFIVNWEQEINPS